MISAQLWPALGSAININLQNYNKNNTYCIMSIILPAFWKDATHLQLSKMVVLKSDISTLIVMLNALISSILLAILILATSKIQAGPGGN